MKSQGFEENPKKNEKINFFLVPACGL